MAAFTTSNFPIPFPSQHTLSVRVRPRRRRITPRAGHALEKLGHAIEYLTDEFVCDGGSFPANNAQLQAVQLLMALNRQVYFECPEVPSFGERLLLLLHQRPA